MLSQSRQEDSEAGVPAVLAADAGPERFWKVGAPRAAQGHPLRIQLQQDWPSADAQHHNQIILNFRDAPSADDSDPFPTGCESIKSCVCVRPGSPRQYRVALEAAALLLQGSDNKGRTWPGKNSHLP